MKRQICIIHGGSAYSNREDFLTQLSHSQLHDVYGRKTKRWRESLWSDLGDAYEVFTPSMPNSENAQYEEWSLWFEKHFGYFRDGVVLVGWSLGGMFLVKYLLEKSLPFKPASLYLLGVPCGSYEDESGDDCGTFQFDSQSMHGLREVIETVHIWHSIDDFVVPFAHAEMFKKYIPSAKLVTFTDRNHFLQETFPELVEEIRGLG